MDYLVNFFDTMLDKHPNISIVCGSDLNCLDITRLKHITGWNVLVDFPTRWDSFLDNCFTNRPDLFGKTYPIKMLIKTDHLGFIVPAGKKVRPICQKVQFMDCREHRKQALYLALTSKCWDEVLEADNIEKAANIRKFKSLSSVSGPYLFNIFLNDLEIKLENETLGFKYADDCTIIAPVFHDKDHSTDLINQFVPWASQNQ